uniref:Max interactor 1, dimerization protein n=1 Tax=Cyprinus carpio carpio TaxID=630221 RepID=A0A9J8C978_CYPCA
MTAVLNIQRLLEAAEYIERRERESEHGYASTFPSIQHSSYQRQRKLRNKKCSNNLNRFRVDQNAV